jgi:hypothetical protein
MEVALFLQQPKDTLDLGHTDDFTFSIPADGMWNTYNSEFAYKIDKNYSSTFLAYGSRKALRLIIPHLLKRYQGLQRLHPVKPSTAAGYRLHSHFGFDLRN